MYLGWGDVSSTPGGFMNFFFHPSITVFQSYSGSWSSPIRSSFPPLVFEYSLPTIFCRSGPALHHHGSGSAIFKILKGVINFNTYPPDLTVTRNSWSSGFNPLPPDFFLDTPFLGESAFRLYASRSGIRSLPPL